MKQTIQSLTDATLTDEQQAAISMAIDMLNSPEPGQQYIWADRLVEQGSDVFGVFGDTAYQAPAQRTMKGAGSTREIMPVLVGGSMLQRIETDGRGRGILVLCRTTMELALNRTPKWLPAFIESGWLRTSELDEPVDATNQRVEQERDRDDDSIRFGAGDDL